LIFFHSFRLFYLIRLSIFTTGEMLNLVKDTIWHIGPWNTNMAKITKFNTRALCLRLVSRWRRIVWSRSDLWWREWPWVHPFCAWPVWLRWFCLMQSPWLSLCYLQDSGPEIEIPGRERERWSGSFCLDIRDENNGRFHLHNSWSSDRLDFTRSELTFAW